MVHKNEIETLGPGLHVIRFTDEIEHQRIVHLLEGRGPDAPKVIVIPADLEIEPLKVGPGDVVTIYMTRLDKQALESAHAIGAIVQREVGDTVRVFCLPDWMRLDHIAWETARQYQIGSPVIEG